MVKIRLRPTKQKGMFHIIAIHSHRKVSSGKALRKLGYYSTITKDGKVDTEGVMYYKSLGAQCTPTVDSIVKRLSKAEIPSSNTSNT